MEHAPVGAAHQQRSHGGLVYTVAAAHQPWQIDDQPRPGVRYRYLVNKPGVHQVPGGPAVAGAPAHHNGLLDIFVAP